MRWQVSYRRNNAASVLRQLVLLERELADALAGGGEDRIADRWGNRRHTGLAHAGWQFLAGHDMHMSFEGRFVHARHRIIIEVRLLYAAVGGRDFAHHRDARA